MQCAFTPSKLQWLSCTATVDFRNWRWLNNDMVNLACALTGAALTALALVG